MAIALVISLAALGFAAWLVRGVLAADPGTAKMQEIAKAVQEGASAYLRRQFRTLAVFAVIVFLLLLLLPVSDGGSAPGWVAPSSSWSAPRSRPRSASSG